MNLWVLRHGEAHHHAPSDAERALTPNGAREVLRSATQLQGQPIDRVLASPLVRAQQTATLVHDALRLVAPILTVPWLTPESDPHDVLSQLADLNVEHVLLVSHQPLVGAVVCLLEKGHVQQPQPMHTASLAHLQGEWPLAGLMTLQGIHQP